MTKLVQSWIDDALSARDHNVSVPALVDKLFTQCHNTGGDPSVVKDECPACRAYRAEFSEKSFFDQSSVLDSTKQSLGDAQRVAARAQAAYQIVKAQYDNLQVDYTNSTTSLKSTQEEAVGAEQVAERRAVEVKAWQASFYSTLDDLKRAQQHLDDAQGEVDRLKTLAKEMVG